MYGPPPDPGQVLVAAPLAAWAWSAAAACALLFAAKRTRGGLQLALATAGGLFALTAPMGGMLGTAVVGSYPTIDKAGSLHFFREGVHWHVLDASNAGVQLIGVHLGHLWVVQLLALVLPDWAGFNVESFVNLWLAWWCTSAWLEHQGARRAEALLLAIPFALNLHQFRDINWYTVEKTAIFLLPLWALSCSKRRVGACAAVGALAMFLNVYMGVLIAAMGAWWAMRSAVARDGRALGCIAATAAGMVPFAAWQAVLMHGAHAPGTPAQFLNERAALDIVSVVPWAWNRLEGWRAMNLLVLVCAAVWTYGEVTWRRSGWVIVGAGLTVGLSLGPSVGGVPNPLYMALFYALPGFWRVAKPETFFFIPWLLAVTACTQVVRTLDLGRRGVTVLGVVLLLGWAWGVRGHAVYPSSYSRPPAESR